jgi:hypothetical protein
MPWSSGKERVVVRTSTTGCSGSAGCVEDLIAVVGLGISFSFDAALRAVLVLDGCVIALIDLATSHLLGARLIVVFNPVEVLFCCIDGCTAGALLLVVVFVCEDGSIAPFVLVRVFFCKDG